jgi:hypothetical protein
LDAAIIGFQQLGDKNTLLSKTLSIRLYIQIHRISPIHFI